MEIVFCFIGFIFGVLNLILFFKIWGMTNDVKELKDALLEEIHKKRTQTSSLTESIQKAKTELDEVEEQDSSNKSPKEALEIQFKIAVKKYKLHCATNSVPDDKYKEGILSMVKAYQKRAKEEQISIDFNSLVE